MSCRVRAKPRFDSMWFIDPLYLTFLATGFAVGFGHCIGMCGPIVVSLAMSAPANTRYIPHLLYQAGRITTYAVLGAIMGLTGSFTGVAAHLAGMQKVVLIAAGLVITLMGLSMGGWLKLGAIFRNGLLPGRIVTKGLQRLSATKSALPFYPLGLLLGLLPCGPVYTAMLAAAGAGIESPGPFYGIAKGAGLMLAFGLGTVPALFLVARLADLGWIKFKMVIYRVGAILMVVVGFYFIVNGIRY